MLDLEQIRKIHRLAAEKQWTYPALFNALKSIGVERYETNVLTHEIKYVGGGQSFLEPAPEGFTPLKVGATYNLPALKAALEQIQKGETTYPQFLGEIAAAGIAFYRVDMRPRTVTYHGMPPDKYVEKVPEA